MTRRMAVASAEKVGIDRRWNNCCMAKLTEEQPVLGVHNQVDTAEGWVFDQVRVAWICW